MALEIDASLDHLADSGAIVQCNQHGVASDNRIKEPKTGFGAGTLLCSDFGDNIHGATRCCLAPDHDPYQNQY